MHKLLSVSLLTAVAGIGAIYACPFCGDKKQEATLAFDTQRDLDEDIDMDDMEDIDEDTNDMDIDDESTENTIDIDNNER